MPAQWQVGSTKQQLPAKNSKSWCFSCGKKHQSPRWYLARLEYDTKIWLEVNPAGGVSWNPYAPVTGAPAQLLMC
jgi:hypothetical protein